MKYVLREPLELSSVSIHKIEEDTDSYTRISLAVTEKCSITVPENLGG